MTKMYLVAMDVSKADVGAFTKHIKEIYAESNRDVTAWWHHIPGGFYLITSELGVDALSEKLRKGLPDKTFILVMAVDRKDSQGWLPTRGWNWINSDGASMD